MKTYVTGRGERSSGEKTYRGSRSRRTCPPRSSGQPTSTTPQLLPSRETHGRQLERAVRRVLSGNTPDMLATMPATRRAPDPSRDAPDARSDPRAGRACDASMHVCVAGGVPLPVVRRARRHQSELQHNLSGSSEAAPRRSVALPSSPDEPPPPGGRSRADCSRQDVVGSVSANKLRSLVHAERNEL
jgi:hypothetical protein